MPVVINDFEVVNEAPPPAPAPVSASAPAPSPDPVELQRQLAALHELALRTWSH